MLRWSTRLAGRTHGALLGDGWPLGNGDIVALHRAIHFEWCLRRLLRAVLNVGVCNKDGLTPALDEASLSCHRC